MKLNVTTDQQAFDAVVTHLSEMRHRSLDLEGNCRYRTDDGNRCAIGALIDDSEYDPLIEGKTVSTLIHHFSPGLVSVPRIDTAITSSLLYDLQRVHDVTDNWLVHDDHVELNVLGWSHLRDIALAYRLGTPLLAPA